MRIKDHTDMVRHLTDPFNIPEARRMIQENPALTQEQFKAGGIVEPGVTHYGTTTEEGPYIFKRKGKYAKKTYYHLSIDDRSGGKTKKIINEMLEATPANLKKLQKQRDQVVKKRWPDRISDEEFRKLRTSDKYKSLNNEDFAKVLDKKGYKTKFGKDWSWDRIQVKQRDLNLLGKVGYKPRRLAPEKEVLDVMKTIKEGPERVEAYIKAGRPKKMLENFRTRVNQKVYYEKYGPDPSRALEWRLKNPEKVKELSMKRFAETGLFPGGKTHKEHLWRDLWRSSQTKVGDRFKFISELPPYKINDRGNKIRNWLKDDHYKKIKFKDTKTGKTITFNNLQKYLDETIGKGTYAKSISGYELKDTLKNQKITYKGKTSTVGGLLKQNLYSPEQLAKQKLLSPFHMQHPGGVGKDWWTNEVVFSDANQKLRDLDSSLTGKLKRAKGFTEKKVLLQKYATDVEKLPGGITSVLRSKTYGITPTSTSIMEAAGKEAGLLKSKNYRTMIEKIGCPGLAAGGRVSFADGSTCYTRGMDKLKKGNIKTPGERANFIKLAKKAGGLKGIARMTGLGLAWEAAFAPVMAAWMMPGGESPARILNELAYGLPIVGETEKEERKRHMGETGFNVSELRNLSGDRESLQMELNEEINRSANVPGKSNRQRLIERDIQKLDEKLIPLVGHFYEGPAGQYFGEEKWGSGEEAEVKGLESLEQSKADWIKKYQDLGLVAKPGWKKHFRTHRMGGGIMGLKK